MSENSWDSRPDLSGHPLVQAVRRQSGVDRFDLAVILGSGWNAGFADQVLVEFSYDDWDCFPTGQIAGHQGCLLVVEAQGWHVLVFSGRFHCYQGLSAFAAAFPVRLAKALGVSRLLTTCATGGINPDYAPGDFMLVEDHLNLLGDNPLRGLAGDIFVDLANLYRTDFYHDLRVSAEAMSVQLHRGVLAAMQGPSYETPAEIRLLAEAGADVVSMSTVPEAIMGRFFAMDVAALAMITNAVAGYGQAPITHHEVLSCGRSNVGAAAELIKQAIGLWKSPAAIDNDFSSNGT